MIGLTLQFSTCIATYPKAQGSGCSRDVEGGGGCEELYDALYVYSLKSKRTSKSPLRVMLVEYKAMR